jgi:RNA polymerase sigma-70 factor (ECF subfamily)
MTVPLLSSVRSDTELVLSIAGGELGALGMLFDRHEPSLRRFLTRIGVSEADVDDLVQATFLEALHAAPRFDPTFPVKAWLYGLASILVRRHRRSLARAAQRLLSWANLGLSDSPRTPAAELAQAQALQRFQVAFERLSAKKRDTFVLVVLEGLSGDEAARVLGVPINTVWTRLHHARRDLRAHLEEL